MIKGWLRGLRRIGRNTQRSVSRKLLWASVDLVRNERPWIWYPEGFFFSSACGWDADKNPERWNTLTLCACVFNCYFHLLADLHSASYCHGNLPSFFPPPRCVSFLLSASESCLASNTDKAGLWMSKAFITADCLSLQQKPEAEKRGRVCLKVW